MTNSTQLRRSIRRVFAFLRTGCVQIVHVLVILSLIFSNLPGIVEAAPAAQAELPTPTEAPAETPTGSVTETPTEIPAETLTASPTSSPTASVSVTETPSPTATQPASPTPIADQATVTTALQSSPVLFIENVGQFDSKARFQVSGGGGTIFLAEDGIWATVLEAKAPSDLIPTDPISIPKQPVEETTRGVNMRFAFVSANLSPKVEGFNRLETKVSYFIGDDSTQWHADVPVWGGARYVDVYPGVDLEVASESGQWAWKLVLKQGATAPSNITLKVAGPETLNIANDRINLTTTVGDFSAPMLKMVAADGSPLSPATSSLINVTLEAMTPTATLTLTTTATVTFIETISPTVTSTETVTPTPTPTATETETPTATETATPTLDANATTTEAPVATPAQSYISQYRVGYNIRSVGVLAAPALRPLASGTNDLLYSTYLGGGSDDYGSAIVVDSSGAAYVTGTTISSNFPFIPGSFDTIINAGDAYVIKINAAGSALVYATFLGGNGNDGGKSLAIDSSGATYITGWVTSGSSFPTTPGALSNNMGGIQDAFVTKLNASGTVLVYSTFLGGSSLDEGDDITVDASGAAYVIGQTNSSNFPVTAGAYDTSYNGDLFNGSGDLLVALHLTVVA